jgi:hypothetical protein
VIKKHDSGSNRHRDVNEYSESDRDEEISPTDNRITSHNAAHRQLNSDNRHSTQYTDEERRAYRAKTWGEHTVDRFEAPRRERTAASSRGEDRGDRSGPPGRQVSFADRSSGSNREAQYYNWQDFTLQQRGGAKLGARPKLLARPRSDGKPRLPDRVPEANPNLPIELPGYLNESLEQREHELGQEIEVAIRVSQELGQTETWQAETICTNLRLERLENETITLKTRTKDLETKMIVINNQMIRVNKMCSVRDATIARLKDMQIKKDRKEVEHMLVLRGWWDSNNWTLLGEEVRNTTVDAICDKAGIDLNCVKRQHRLPNQNKMRVSEWTELLFDDIETKKKFKFAIKTRRTNLTGGKTIKMG